MRKILLVGSILVVLFGGFIYLHNKGQQNFNQIPTSSAVEKDDEGENEDGILLDQEQDFKNTRDINLGYIPRNRLIEATENLKRERVAMRTNSSMRTAAINWTERGPNTDGIGPSNGNARGPGSTAVTSGRIRAIWIDLADVSNKTVWVGGVDGGIWKTTDVTASSATWTPVNDFFSNLAIASICQDPTNTNVMYFGTGEKTYNLDAVQGGGIWKSTDHGLTWNLLPTTTSFYNISKIICDATGNLFAAIVGGQGIKRSADGGASWTTITPTGLVANVTEMKLSTTGRLHIVCGYYNSGTSGYRYTDNPATVTSATWTSAVTSFSPDNYNVEIATAGNTLYALPADVSYQTPVVWKSTDGGANWSVASNTLPITGHSAISSAAGWYCLALGVDPANPNNVIAGGLNTYRSTDGGTTWTQAADWASNTAQYVHADQHAVIWSGSRVLIASDGGIFYSPDGGVSWADRNTGLRIKQFYSCAIHPTLTDYFIGGAQDNGMHQMNHPGLGGSTEFIGGDGFFGHIDQDQPQYQFGSYVYNTYRRSTNGGSTWSTVTYSSSLGSFSNPSDYDDYNNKMYAADAAGKYVRWENPQTGSTFTPVSVGAFNGNNVTHVAVSPNTGNRVFFGTDGGKVVKVDNADLNTPISTNITGSGMTVGAVVSCVASGTNDNNLLATFSNYGASHVWVTTTGGGASGWTNISGNLPDIPVRWAMFYPYDNTKAILATEAGIFETSNINGASTIWIQSPDFPIVRTDMLQYRSSDGTVLAATHGRGLWTAQIPVTNTYVKFSATSLSRPESTTATVATGCTGYTDYTIYLATNRAPSGSAIATLSVAGGTAVQGVDFNFTTNGNFASPSNVITLASGSTSPQPITIRIYDNANNESISNRNFSLTYTLSGATDATPTPGGQTFSFTINDDDLPPSLVGSPGIYSVGTYTVNSSNTGAFRSTFQKNRLQSLYRASELTAAGLSAGKLTALNLIVAQKNSTKPFMGFTIAMAQTTATSLTVPTGFIPTGFTQVYTGDYTSVLGDNTFTFGTGAGSSSSFTWDGTSNIVIQFCYDNGSATADVSNDLIQGSNPSASLSTSLYSGAATGSGCSLAATTASNARVNATFTAQTFTSGNAVETVLNATKTQSTSGNSDVYFYNGTKIMARIQNMSGFNFGCTQVTVDRAGAGAVPFWNNNPANYVTTKSFQVVPTTNNPSGQYQITLYYTAAEKAAWETATGQNWNTIQIVKVKSQIKNYSPSTPFPDGPGAVETVTPTFGTFGADYTLTATFSSGFSGFAAGNIGFPLPVTLLDFTGRLENNSVVLNWSTSTEQNSKNFDVEKSTDGVNFYNIGSVNAAGNSSTRKDYGLRDDKLSPVNYYRLRMNDLDGHNKLSNVVVIRYDVKAQNVWVIKNPFSNAIDLRLAKEATQVRLQLVDAKGAVVAEKMIAKPSGLIHWDMTNNISAGSYILRTVVDGKTFTHKLIKQ